MAKKLRRVAAKRRRPVAPSHRRSVTRREFAELAVRLGAAELQMQRNRTIMDELVQRVTHLQQQADALAAGAAKQSLVAELPSLPLVTTPTVES